MFTPLEQELWTAVCETDGGQFDMREYSTEVIYSVYDRDSDRRMCVPSSKGTLNSEICEQIVV